MTIAPEKRSGAMKAVITGEQMQMELLELLQSLPDDVETEAFHTIVMKVNLLVVLLAYSEPKQRSPSFTQEGNSFRPVCMTAVPGEASTTL